MFFLVKESVLCLILVDKVYISIYLYLYLYMPLIKDSQFNWVGILNAFLSV